MKKLSKQFDLYLRKNKELILYVCPLVVLLLVSFQGIDVCDEGWYLTFYQQFFNAPETVEYNFVFWLTGLIGGLWYEVFYEFGILGFRVLTVLVFVLISIFVLKILTPYVKKVTIIWGLLLVVFLNDYGYTLFYYNHLSGLIIVISCFYLICGISKNNNLYLFISGFVVMLNVFARLPNITLFFVISVFPLSAIISNSQKRSYWVKECLVFIFGSLISLIVVIITLKILGHADIFIASIKTLINKGGNNDSNHNIFKMLMVYKNNYLNILKAGLKFSVVFLLILSLLNYSKETPFLKFLISLLGFFLFYFILDESLYIFYFMGLSSGVLVMIFKERYSLNFKLLTYLSIIVMTLLPLGSDGGIDNVGYMALWLIMPISLSVYQNLNDLSITIDTSNVQKKFRFNDVNFNYTFKIFIITYLLFKFYNISTTSYFDKGSRFKKVVEVDTPLSKWVYTNEKRAEIINTVLNELKNHVKKDDYLLAYDNIPLVNYLTETKPYIGISWVWVYDSEIFDSKIKEAEKNIEALPIVVQQKFVTIGDFQSPTLDYMSEEKEETYIYKRGRVKAMNAFLLRNKYEVIWENEYFNIHKSKLNKLKK